MRHTTVQVAHRELPLGEVVVALLTRRIQFQEFLGSGPSELVMVLWSSRCWACKQPMTVWKVSEIVTGRTD